LTLSPSKTSPTTPSHSGLVTKSGKKLTLSPAQANTDRPFRPSAGRSARPSSSRPSFGRSRPGEGVTRRGERPEGRTARPSSSRPSFGRSKPGEGLTRRGERPAGRRPAIASGTFAKPSVKIKTVRKAVVPERPNEKETVRLNRFIASAGIAARRKADELITRGKVTVNGKIVRELGVQVNPNTDLVTVDGNTISMKTRHVYLLLNKPKDAISTVKDETDRNTVMNYVNTRERVYPVGRLDRNTTGVLLLTNDGDLTARLTHPKYQIEREYHVTLDKPLNKVDAQKIAEGGVDLGEGETSSPVHLAYAHNDPKDVYVVIREGKYREIRRLFEAFHYDVRKLDRTMFAGITHRGMKRGESRVLSPKEVRDLKKIVGLDVREKWEG
jgi:pseudouridine synthase